MLLPAAGNIIWTLKTLVKVVLDHQINKHTMRKKVIAANWKMNEDYFEGLSLFTDIIKLTQNEVTGNQQVIVCPPFIHLYSLAELSKNHPQISIGAQNAHQKESGAYTGEISAKMIRSTGAEYVILGHSERRLYFNETNELVAKKIDTALLNNLKIICCIGETKKEREAVQQFEVLEKQLTDGLFHLDNAQFEHLTIAYEPIWAIGTGVTATAAQAQEIHRFIRKQVSSKYSGEIAENTTILYGGSCNSKNATELFSQEDIDGGLIGGASLKACDFVDIIKSCN
jgi:triosephosphate isomerase